jgi:nitronate monooxygenase
MPFKTTLTQKLGLTHPFVQAPMAGGATTAELVATACEAGILGCIGAAYLTPAQILDAAREVRARTSRPYAINLFAPVRSAPPGNVDAAVTHLARYHQELGLPPPAEPKPAPEPFDAQLEAVLQAPPAVFSFTFAPISAAAVAEIRRRGCFLIGTATTVDEAVQLEALGVDAVVAQGGEAGAHRGTFAVDFDMAMIGTLALVPQVVDAVKIPVIAAGGIMDGRGIAAVLALGASAAQMGTAFLTCDETGVSESHKQAILGAKEDQTRTTRAFSGRPARTIVNRFMSEMEASGAILPYPLQNALTRPLRTAAAKAGRPEYLSLWAGQGVRMARRQKTADLIRRLAEELDAAIDRLAART